MVGRAAFARAQGERKGALMATSKAIIQKKMAGLKDLARVAEAVIDGDLAMQIITDRASYYLLNSPPEHFHMPGDYYDVEHDKFLRMKKSLRRLEKLVDFPCGSTLWIKCKGSDKFVTVAVHNNRSCLHRYFSFSDYKLIPPPEMKECFVKGRAVAAPVKVTLSGLTMLAPVRDSMGVVVAVAEFSASHPAAKPESPEWK
jgi:hypothetical protein